MVVEIKCKTYIIRALEICGCILFIFALYKGCQINQVLFFRSFSPNEKLVLDSNEVLENLLQKKQAEGFCEKPEIAMTYKEKSDGKYIEYVKIYVVSQIKGLARRKYTFSYHPMFILSLNESKSYVYKDRRKKSLPNILSLTDYGEAQKSYRTGWNFEGTIIDTYIFYPVQDNSISLDMNEHISYYFQLRMQGY